MTVETLINGLAVPDMPDSEYSYLPHAGSTCSQSHPDRLAVLARLFGMKPAAIGQARILEIGCSFGGNIIPIASSLPESQVVGIALTAHEAKECRDFAHNVGLKNIQIKHWQELDAQGKLGQFDYVIVHGVFSWVAAELQEKILRLCRRYLAADGIAYVDYNTNPGWRSRSAIRDIIQFHTATLTDEGEKQKQAANVVAVLSRCADSMMRVNSGGSNAFGIGAYDALLKNELQMLNQPFGAVYLQEHLTKHCQPLYLYQFAEMAAKHDLQYLGEAQIATMLPGHFPQDIQDALKPLAGDLLKTEQYMDFVRNRSFRQTLLCRADVELNREVQPENIYQFFVASPVEPQGAIAAVNSDEPQAFVYREAGNSVFTTREPMVKAAMTYLSRIWPRSVSFESLASHAISCLSNEAGTASPGEAARKKLAGDLLMAHGVNLVQFRTREDAFVTEISSKPKASNLARTMAPAEGLIVNQLHESLRVDVFTQNLLPLLDGTRERREILDGLSKLVADGTLVVQKDGKQMEASDRATSELLEASLQECLHKLARLAVLVG